MADVVLIVLRGAETVRAVLQAGQRMATLMGGARLNVLAVRAPIQITGLAVEALIAEADSVVSDRAQEQQRVAAIAHSLRSLGRRDGQ
jgi:Flp pilus assembly protein TadB